MGRKWLLCMCSMLMLTGCGQAKTYWTEEVQEAQVSLRDGTEDGTLDLVLRWDGTETVLRTMVRGTDFSRTRRHQRPAVYGYPVQRWVRFTYGVAERRL